MSRLKLTRKLKPAKKAWKNFSNTVQSKLHKLNISKAFKTTLQLILSAFHTLSHLILPSKFHRSLTAKNKSYSTSSYSYVQRKNFAAIHINDLYSEPSSSAVSINASTTNKNSSIHNHVQGETSRRGKEVYDENMDLHGDDIDTIEDAWKAVVAKSPLLQVDQKAEEFIYKFREDMRLQKEKSLLEFQERLARST